MKTCGYCLSEIPDGAHKCKFCGEWLVFDEYYYRSPFFHNTTNIKTIKNFCVFLVVLIMFQLAGSLFMWARLLR